MKVAITATGPSLKVIMDPRFGRCSYFILVETDDMSFEAVENPNLSLGGGAGIQSAQLMVDKGVKFVLTGNCGPNAHQTLSAACIGVVVGCDGSVADVVGRFKSGQLGTTDRPNVSSHFGMAGEPGPQDERRQTTMGGGMGFGKGGGWGKGGGRARGMGQGQGGGRGMGGMRQGMGRGMGMEVPPPDPSVLRPDSPDQEVEMLRAQADAMVAQLQNINARISEIQARSRTALANVADAQIHKGEPGGATGERIVAVVDLERCAGCNICAEVCPEGAITVENVAMIDPQKCTGCGSCIDECPNDAISLPI